jgi:hypothetical protein
MKRPAPLLPWWCPVEGYGVRFVRLRYAVGVAGPASEAKAMQVLALVMCRKPALLAAQVVNTDHY